MAGVGNYQFPQKSAPITSGEKGIASLYHPEVGTLRFRSNPKEFNWSYTLNKRIDQTYGGRVIQLLGTRIDDFTFTADCGTGRWAYMNKVAKYMRDVMIKQRGGTPATFEYTTRGWKFNAYIVAVPFADAVEEVLREFEVTMKVQEDVSGVMSQNTMVAELRRLKDGIAFRRSRYNDPLYGNQAAQVNDSESYQAGIDQVIGALEGAAASLNLSFLPTNPAGLNSLINSFTGAANTQNGAR